MKVSSLRRFAVIAVSAASLAVASAAFATKEEGDKDVSRYLEWDQIASIRGAAERLGKLHRSKGAKAAYELIDNCYRTHILAKEYGEGFEICITQDYLETRTLIQVYSQMPPEALAQLGVPSPQELAETMGQRISTAFRHYQKPQAYADQLKRLVDMHGFPVFIAIVFPESVKPIEKNTKEQKK